MSPVKKVIALEPRCPWRGFGPSTRGVKPDDVRSQSEKCCVVRPTPGFARKGISAFSKKAFLHVLFVELVFEFVSLGETSWVGVSLELQKKFMSPVKKETSCPEK